jgi:hypothetical protein
MNRNVGGRDRTVRLVAGFALLAVGVAGDAGWVPLAVGPFPQAGTSLVLALAGLATLASGLLRICLVNRLLGRDTTRQ